MNTQTCRRSHIHVNICTLEALTISPNCCWDVFEGMLSTAVDLIHLCVLIGGLFVRERGGKVFSGFLSLCPLLFELIVFSPRSDPWKRDRDRDHINSRGKNFISQLVLPSPFTVTTD